MTAYEMNNITLKEFIGYAMPHTPVRVLYDNKSYEPSEDYQNVTAYNWYNYPISTQLEVIRFDIKYDFARQHSVLAVWVRFRGE